MSIYYNKNWKEIDKMKFEISDVSEAADVFKAVKDFIQ